MEISLTKKIQNNIILEQSNKSKTALQQYYYVKCIQKIKGNIKPHEKEPKIFSKGKKKEKPLETI